MPLSQTSTALQTMNFIVGLALLVMLFPSSTKPAEKPAGVRTAIELFDKRSLKCVCLSALLA
jgi:hypothetical protein